MNNYAELAKISHKKEIKPEGQFFRVHVGSDIKTMWGKTMKELKHHLNKQRIRFSTVEPLH